jgi:LAS superfamily LD-carboxypeptidase LdcB
MVRNFFTLRIAKPFVYILLVVGLSGIAYAYTTLFDAKVALDIKVSEKEMQISKLILDNLSLADIIQNKDAQTESLKSTVDNITSQVKTLEKIKDTDKELLQKYSKVFFLNEHYIPKGVSDVPSTLLTPNSKSFQIHSQVYSYLEKMILASRDANNPIQIVSAYRSFGTQANLKTAYKSTFGSGANKFSADQGYSEHQLGTTVDLTTPILQNTFVSFEKTPAFKWLTEHAHEYGFTLSYPKNNAYYEYEPWHWRFVGTKLATKLHAEGKYFYDLDQREIDDYLLNIFD